MLAPFFLVKNMSFKQLDLKTWPRIKQYEFFKQYDNPFFNISTNLDVTQLLSDTKASGQTFSMAMLYASIDTANRIDEFKYRLKDDGVVVYDSIYAGSTVLNDDKTFSFCYFDYFNHFSEFDKFAKKQIDMNNKGLLEFDGRNKDLDIIHYSVIPWIAFSSFSHPRNYKTDDSVPKIVFGQYHEKGGRVVMPISVEVHHALMDGYHLGQYFSELQKTINNPIFLKK